MSRDAAQTGGRIEPHHELFVTVMLVFGVIGMVSAVAAGRFVLWLVVGFWLLALLVVVDHQVRRLPRGRIGTWFALGMAAVFINDLVLRSFALYLTVFAICAIAYFASRAVARRAGQSAAAGR